MCATLDANYLNEAFGDGNRPEAGKFGSGGECRSAQCRIQQCRAV